MAVSTHTPVERVAIVELANEHGDAYASEATGVPESTIRSWRARHRSERKVTDYRARDDDDDVDLGSEAATEASSHEMVDVSVPDGGWDGAAGRESKVSARARVIEHPFELGSAFVSRGDLRELKASGVESLSVGDILLLGGSHVAGYSDALWVVARPAEADDRVMVRPGRIRSGQRLSEDRSRVVARTAADKPHLPVGGSAVADAVMRSRGGRCHGPPASFRLLVRWRSVAWH